jgi:NAD-dependent protein deacetylase/lipoamidase
MSSRAPDLSTAASELASLLRGAERVVALTGAGISVPSGIPDFRTPGTGIWENVDPMEVATIQAFRSDPARFWSFYRPRFEALGDKRPNPAHQALVELESWGLEAVITQNVDRLHRKAGSSRVIEVHGSIQTSSCTACPGTWQLDEVEALFDDDGVATCPSCMGYVKPDVVLFGEMLPERAMQEAADLAQDADLMLCVGSSLEVYPVAGLPEITLASGGALAVVTQSPTPYDDAATVRMNGDVVEDLEAVLGALRA